VHGGVFRPHPAIRRGEMRRRRRMLISNVRKRRRLRLRLLLLHRGRDSGIRTRRRAGRGHHRWVGRSVSLQSQTRRVGGHRSSRHDFAVQTARTRFSTKDVNAIWRLCFSWIFLYTTPFIAVSPVVSTFGRSNFWVDSPRRDPLLILLKNDTEWLLPCGHVEEGRRNFVGLSP
jgi:hypothetical protein